MKCPVCKEINLLMSERQGVEIDYCPECRGIWLDRNELDKIIEMSVSNMNNHNYENKDNYNQPQETNNDYKNNKKYKNNKTRKKESILGELFDIF